MVLIGFKKAKKNTFINFKPSLGFKIFYFLK